MSRRRSRRKSRGPWVVVLLAVIAALAKYYAQTDVAKPRGSARPSQGSVIEGSVVGVSDGDTISVLAGAAETKVRLHGIDCPETGQPFGRSAKQFTSERVFGKTVAVRVQDVDRYGRTVGEVFVDGSSLNLELVAAGMAWWYRQYSSDAAYGAAESAARAKLIGLWSDANPVPPWDWRKHQLASRGSN